MSAFAGSSVTKNGSFTPSSDNKVPNLRSIDMKSMQLYNSLSGQSGVDCKLIHGDRWQQIDGSQTEKINVDLTTDIMEDETWTVHGNLFYTVQGLTYDAREKDHFQVNWTYRYDHFMETRTETHDQPQVIHNPTEHTNWINKLTEFHWYKSGTTALYIAANAMKMEVDMVETTGKLVVAEKKGFTNSDKGKEWTFAMVKTYMGGVYNRVLASRNTAAPEHAEAEATVNVAPTGEDGAHVI